MTDLSLREQIAITLWRNEAVLAAPNVAKQRTDAAFLDANDDDRSRWLNHADAILELLEGAVKTLEWIECQDGSLHDTHCQYEITTDGGFWRVTKGVTGGGSYVCDCSDLDQAKATAQADYSTCILAALGVK